MQEWTGFLQSHVVTALVYFRPMGLWDGGKAVLPHSARQPLDVQGWCELRWRQGRPPTEALQWQEPSPPQAGRTPLTHDGLSPDLLHKGRVVRAHRACLAGRLAGWRLL